MSGHFVHLPPVPHVCYMPEGVHLIGTLWRCDDCKAYWRADYTLFGQTWHEPFWPNILPRRWAEKWWGK